MRVKRTAVGSICLCLALAGIAFGAERERQASDIRLAKVAIAVELLNGHGRETRFACSRNHPACAGPAKGELGLAVLRNIRTREGARALLEIGAFGLDAGLAEDYDCAVATSGPEVRRQLAIASPRRNRAACLAFFGSLIRSMPDHKDVDVTRLCLSEAELSREYAAIRKIRTSDCEA